MENKNSSLSLIKITSFKNNRELQRGVCACVFMYYYTINVDLNNVKFMQLFTVYGILGKIIIYPSLYKIPIGVYNAF